MIPSLSYPLDSPPRLVQCGMCVHGLRAKETFAQRGLWSLHFYHYPGRLRFRRGEYSFLPGWASLLPPDEEVTWTFPAHAAHYYAHFRISGRSRGLMEVPLLQPLENRRPQFESSICEMIRHFPSNNSRCDVRLWDLLHVYAESRRSEREAPEFHPSVQIALSILRNQVSPPVRVGRVARQMGVSHNQLTLLFKKQFGCGVREFVRRERMTEALHQLLHSRLPIKSIAAECGFSDLQYFNKQIRASFGQSPTALRESRSRRPPGRTERIAIRGV